MAPEEGLSFTESQPLGGAWVLDALWNWLGIATTMGALLAKSRREAVTERAAGVGPDLAPGFRSWWAHDGAESAG